MSTSLGFAQRPSPSARAFVVETYAQYKDGNRTPFTLNPEDVYSPQLLRLMNDDKKNAGEGYEGALDSDQICQCQDWDHLRLLSLQIHPRDKMSADADVVLQVMKGESRHTRLRLKLVLVPGGWRIDDVEPRVGMSTRELLASAKY